MSTWLFQIHWIWYVSTNSSGSNFWIQKIFCLMMRWRSYVGMPVLTYDTSAICQDPDLLLSEADLKDLVVPVCHHHTPAIGYLAKSRHLAILSDSIKPWPMTNSQSFYSRGSSCWCHCPNCGICQSCFSRGGIRWCPWRNCGIVFGSAAAVVFAAAAVAAPVVAYVGKEGVSFAWVHIFYAFIS